MIFSANDGTHGEELWITDGTTNGTVLLKDIRPGSGGSGPRDFVRIDENVFFRAGGANGRELWKTDGTANGTVRVKEISSDPYLSVESPFINVNGRLFFSAYDAVNGKELWMSDGTADGTILVKDLWPGEGSSNPKYLVNANGVLFFRAESPGHGSEIWRSDGTVEGTFQLPDIAPGDASSVPTPVAFRDGIVAVANDGIHGVELWTFVDVNAAPSFAKGADVNSTDEGHQSVDGWASGISRGPPDEIWQTLDFAAIPDQPGLFLEQPRIDSSGRLTFTPMPNASGTANVTVVLTDDGGTANGGVDVSGQQTFVIHVVKAHVWHNAANGLDVTGPGGLPDGAVVAEDALEIINFINAFGSQPVPTDGRATGPYCDVNADGSVAPGDALDVINHINAFGEGEAPSAESTREAGAPVRNAEWEAVGEGFAEGESGRGGEGERAGVSSQEETAFEEVLELLAGEKTLQSRRRRGAW